MTTARAQLAAALTAALPAGYDVVPDARRVERFDGVTALVQLLRTAIAKDDRAPLGYMKHDFDVLVVVPYQDSTAGEDVLDEAVDEVLVALEGTGWVSFEKSERATYEEGYLAFKISATAFIRTKAENN